MDGSRSVGAGLEQLLAPRTRSRTHLAGRLALAIAACEHAATGGVATCVVFVDCGGRRGM